MPKANKSAKAAGKAPRYGPTHFPSVPFPEPLDVPPPWEGGDGKAKGSGLRAEGSGLQFGRRLFEGLDVEARVLRARAREDAGVALATSTAAHVG